MISFEEISSRLRSCRSVGGSIGVSRQSRCSNVPRSLLIRTFARPPIHLRARSPIFPLAGCSAAASLPKVRARRLFQNKPSGFCRIGSPFQAHFSRRQPPSRVSFLRRKHIKAVRQSVSQSVSESACRSASPNGRRYGCRMRITRERET